MKKTILAMAVAGLFATTAQAATVYDADGATVGLFGDADVQYYNGTAEDKSDGVNDGVIRIDDADFGLCHVLPRAVAAAQSGAASTELQQSTQKNTVPFLKTLL